VKGIVAMQAKSAYANIEVSGDCIGAILDGFRQYPVVAMKYLARFGLIRSDTLKPSEIDRAAWYPLDAWLAVYRGIVEEVGVNSMYAIGRRMPENAWFPPRMNDVHEAIRSIDVAYHMNHRKDGVVMFDPKTGAMLEGIGHYIYCRRDEKTIECVCENPYPCDFDRGLVSAMAARFEEFSRTSHAAAGPCRKNGGASCTYVVTL
jgi:hypothetical protein